MKFVKLLDGGVTDSFGTTGLAVERARAQAASAPMTPAEAVKLKHPLFLVADAGVQKDDRWTQKIPDPGCIGLAAQIASASLSAATRSGCDAMRGEVRQWQQDLIEWRGTLPLAQVRRLRGSTAGWDGVDVKRFVGRANFEGAEPALRDRLNKIPTRLRRSTEAVDLAIEAGRLATRASPEFNGFLASLDGNSVQDRITAGIAQGGRRIAPSN